METSELLSSALVYTVSNNSAPKVEFILNDIKIHVNLFKVTHPKEIRI